MGNVCDPLFSKKTFSGTSEACTHVNTSQRPWFDDECQEPRKLFYFVLNNYRRNKTTENQLSLIRAWANYKRILRQKRFYFEKSKTSKLIVSKRKNAKEYWKLLKQAANLKNKNSISVDQFSEYFQSINDPNEQMRTFYFFNERYLRGEIQIMFDEQNVTISLEEIRKGIKQLRNGASAGPDLMLNEFLKHGSNGLLSYLHHLLIKYSK